MEISAQEKMFYQLQVKHHKRGSTSAFHVRLKKKLFELALAPDQTGETVKTVKSGQLI